MSIAHDWFPAPASTHGPSAWCRLQGLDEPPIQPEEALPEASYKNAMDRALAAVGLVVLSPLIAALCVLIKLTSRGPAFYRQERVGRHGKIFRIFKLRTMVDGAERETGPVWATENDPRVTWIGSFLRKTHLDELPQLINVLMGDMSLVGPRPERPVFVEKFKDLIPDYGRRLQVKPGITGLAQLYHGYDATIHDVRAKLDYDFRYMRTMCVKRDLYIVLLTARYLTRCAARFGPPADSDSN